MSSNGNNNFRMVYTVDKETQEEESGTASLIHTSSPPASNVIATSRPMLWTPSPGSIANITTNYVTLVSLEPPTATTLTALDPSTNLGELIDDDNGPHLLVGMRKAMLDDMKVPVPPFPRGGQEIVEAPAPHMPALLKLLRCKKRC